MESEALLERKPQTCYVVLTDCVAKLCQMPFLVLTAETDLLPKGLSFPERTLPSPSHRRSQCKWHNSQQNEQFFTMTTRFVRGNSANNTKEGKEQNRAITQDADNNAIQYGNDNDNDYNYLQFLFKEIFVSFCLPNKVISFLSLI